MSSPEGLSMIWLIPGFPILAAILFDAMAHSSEARCSMDWHWGHGSKPCGSKHCLPCNCERSR